MSMTLNGSGSISGLAAGGLPDGTITTPDLADNTITNAKLAFDGGAFGFRNKIINGDMRIAQRATSSTANGYTTLDRMFVVRGGGSNTLAMSQVTTGAFGENRSYLRIQRNAGDTLTNTIDIYQPIEQRNTFGFAGQTVTMSVRIGAVGCVGTTFYMLLAYQTSTTDQGIGGPWVHLPSDAQTLSAGPSTYTQTFTLPANATQIMPFISFLPTGTAPADESRYITDWQLELGSVATPFEARPYGLELALCQRYYVDVPLANYAGGIAGYAPNSYLTSVKFPVVMRSIPTISVFDRLGSSGVGLHKAATEYLAIPITTLSANTNGFFGNTTTGVADAGLFVFSYKASAEL